MRFYFRHRARRSYEVHRATTNRYLTRPGRSSTSAMADVAQSPEPPRPGPVLRRPRVGLPDSGLFGYAQAEDEPVEAYYDNDYFYSTAAHNTVVVDGVNQSREGKVGQGLTIQGATWRYQSGWHQLYHDVTHRRGVLLLRQDVVLVVDELDGVGSHDFAQTWHLMPDLNLSTVGLDTFGTDASGQRVVAIHQGLADGLSMETSASGSLPSWYSDTYGEKSPSSAVSYTVSGSHATFLTLITTGPLAEKEVSVSGSSSKQSIVVELCVGTNGSAVVIDHLADQGEMARVAEESATCRPAPAAPSVAVTQPAEHAAATGVTILAASVDAANPIARVEFAVNGSIVGSVGHAPYQISWDSRTVPDGKLVAVTATAYDAKGKATTSAIRHVVVSNPPAEAPNQTVVSLTFDDSLADQFAAREMLAAHDMHATFFVISGRVGLANAMTWDQIAQLAADGNEIGGHTVGHLDLASLEPDEQQRQICNDRVRLMAKGYDVISFAYPFAFRDQTTVQIAKACGYVSARVTNGVGGNGPTVESVPPKEQFEVRTVGSFSADTTLAEMESYVQAAEAREGGWVPLVFHNVCANACRSNAVSPRDLQALIDWLAVRNGRGTVVKTVGEVLSGPLEPAVAGPPPPAFGSNQNLLRNPGLEDPRRT